jgi:hypothetical protein
VDPEPRQRVRAGSAAKPKPVMRRRRNSDVAEQRLQPAEDGAAEAGIER